ncbi:MAG: hypothetical protein U0936_00195 [Planctomycetaceae bacterium]
MILDEARELSEDGVRELILVAQDTTYYGMDSTARFNWQNCFDNCRRSKASTGFA